MFSAYRISINPNFKAYYKKYCKILSSVISTAKKMHFDKMILNSTNKPKTTWNIVKTISNRVTTPNNFAALKISDIPTNNPFAIANAFNSYFLSVAENLKLNNNNNLDSNSANITDPLFYLKQNFKQTFLPIKMNNTSTHEIDKINH